MLLDKIFKDESKVPENKCDVCYKNNCANNSTCIAKLNSDNSYQCICSPGYHGEKCEQRIDACYGQPCKNQGVCNVLMEGRYK
jgi:slit protein 2